MEIETIKELISEAGWYEGRKIEISYMTDDLKSAGYTIPNALVNSLLEEFWNIRIEFTYPDGYETDIFLNIDDAISSTRTTRNVEITRRIDEHVVPVGTIASTYVIWLTYSGKFYISQLELLYYLGDDIFSMIDFVFSQGDLDSREIK